jgi:hypothetical protein
VVIVPVAALQEAKSVPVAIAEYAKQDTNDPFTVVLGLNCPTDKRDSGKVQDTIAAVELAKETYPDLDIRSVFVEYQEPVIGRIRHDLWNGVAAAVIEMPPNTQFGSHTIGVNHDIDLIGFWQGSIKDKS